MMQKENTKSLKISCGSDGWKVTVFRDDRPVSHRYYRPTQASVLRIRTALRPFFVNGRLMNRNIDNWFGADEMSITWYRHPDGWY